MIVFSSAGAATCVMMPFEPMTARARLRFRVLHERHADGDTNIGDLAVRGTGNAPAVVLALVPFDIHGCLEGVHVAKFLQ